MAIFIPLVTKFDNKGLTNARNALSKFGGFAADIAKAATAAVAGVAVAGVREAAQFETTFSKIQGLVGLTADEIADLEKAARDLAPQFGKSGNEAADALFFITSAGLRGASAVDVLESSLKGSAIGLGNVEDIANAATAAMNTYGESNLSGTDAVDTLAEAVRLGQFAPEELAGALGRVIPISSELGVSFQETAGLIAGLTRGGLSASESVTGIRGAMQAVLKPTGESAEMLEKYGFSAENVRDSIEKDGLLATFGRLREAFGENDEDFTRLIGSQEGLNAILALTGENTETYTGIVAEMTDGIGILDDAMAITADTAEFKFDSAMASARDILLEIGLALLERLQPYLDRFLEFMDKNGPFIEQMFDNIFGVVEILTGKLGELGEAIMPVVIDLFTDENFQSALERIGESFLLIVDEVIKFINSDLGQFLLDLTATSIIVGINTLAAAFEFLNIVLAEFNRLLTGPVRQTEMLKGLSFGEVTTEMRRGGIEGSGGYLDFATGGVVMPKPGGVMGRLAEVGQPEVVIPLAQLDSMLSEGARSGGGDRKAVYNINVNAGMGANGSQIGEQIVTAIKRYERTSGPVFARA